MYLLSLSCSSLIWTWIKQVGMHVIKGGSLTKIAMPIGLSRPTTYLQHIAEECCLAPLYLGKAAEDANPVSRMKYVMAFMIGGIHRFVFFISPVA